MRSHLFSYTLFFQAASCACAARCPSWFDETGAEIVAANADIPGLQMRVSSIKDGIECRGAWTNDNFSSSPLLTEDNPYRLASITKTFTSTGALKLIEDGIIHHNHTVEDYLPQWALDILIDTQGAENVSQITPWQLMHHTSGIGEIDSMQFNMMWFENPDLNMSREEFLKWGRDNVPPSGPPGTVFAYSDLGYAYLAIVISHMSGRPTEAVVREAAQMDELGMDSTWWDIFEEPLPGTPPRAGSWAGDEDITNIHGSVALYGGTGLISNADDLVTFARATHQGKLLNETTMDLLYSLEEIDVEWYDPWIGCGWMYIPDLAGLETWYHRGGFGTFMYYFPERDLAVTGAILQMTRLPLMRDIVPEVVEKYLSDLE